MKLKDKVCIVTGGSGGIGYAVCDRFLSEGAIVVLTSIDMPSAIEAQNRLQEKYPDGTVIGIAPTPLWSFTETEKAFKEVYERFGKIDILVNNAGTSDETAFDQYTEDIYDRLFNLNIKAMFACTRAVINFMEEKGQGVIINTSSVVSVCGQPKGVAYPASKSAVNGFTLSLAREIAKKGIRVNAVAPGVTKTTMLKDVPARMLEPVVQMIPLKRIGEAEDVANAVLFLASDEASYISGTVLNVDGLVRF
ncbi:MAG: 3-oxoacyl-ACP reductase FabG [Clostridia bacterium]|nr:3-oxoacyl-ACP reductase FabG [Clostridia bacterium]